MKIALFQMDTLWENPTANCAKVEAWLEGAASGGELPDLLILPEMFTTGFTMTPERLCRREQTKALERSRELAMKYQVAIIGSLATAITTPEAQTQYVNRLHFIHPDGRMEHYDKHHLFRMGEEHLHYRAGDEVLVVEYKGWRICPLVCYDLRFPLWSRNTSELNYDLLIYIASWPAPRSHAWSTLLRARAIENLAFVAGVNRCGNDPKLAYSGDTALIDFKGEALKEASSHTEQVICSEIELEPLRAFREKFPCHLDADRFTLNPTQTTTTHR